MKKIFFALCLALALAGCKKEETSQQIQLDFSAGTAYYYGDYYNIGCDNYYVVLEGDATLYIDINVPVSTNTFIPQGNYSPRTSDKVNYTFNLGYKNPGGTVDYSCVAIGSTAYAVEGGEITFSYDRSSCVVGGRIIANGTEYAISFSGELEIVTVTGDDDDDDDDDDDPDPTPIPGDLTGGALSGAFGYYYGDYYEVGADNYYLYIYKGDYDTDGSSFTAPGVEICLELLTTTGNGTIPAGTYAYSESESDGAGHFLCGWVDEDEQLVYPSYLYIQNDSTGDDYYLDIIDGGSVKIEKSGSTYSISAEIQCGGSTYSYTYEGTISIEDYSTAAVSATKAKLSSRPGRKSNKPAR